MFQRFTDSARRVVVLAQEEARTLGHNYIGTEHLLLAMFGDADDLAAKILTQLGAGYDDYRNRIIEKLSGYTKPKP